MNNTSAEAWAAEYPRPQLKRAGFYPLGTGWTLNGLPITMPFPPQAEASGYKGEIGDTLHYRSAFTLPHGYGGGGRVRLHFGAVDQLAEVVLNGRAVARHEGGYLPFWADITDALRAGENELLVTATDTHSRHYPYGKQRKKRGGMWYTPVSGIWQPVWLEAVPKQPIEEIRTTTIDAEKGLVRIEIAPAMPCTITLQCNGRAHVIEAETGAVTLDIAALGETPHPWTPDEPYLYSFTAASAEDTVESYFALRTVKVEQGRIKLNGKPIFLHGVLDQGYFAAGHYLPLTPAGYEQDVLAMKELGFNTLRKHIKIEPQSFYYACDRCGMLVLQDMVNSGGYSWLLDTALPNLGLQRRPDCLPKTKRWHFFRRHALQTLELLYSHPCVIGYTIFNEGWGQCRADEMYDACKAADPTRFYDATSGWFAQKRSDVESLHVYFKNKRLVAQKRPMLLSECGGYARPVPGHMYMETAKFGYGTAKTEAELTGMIQRLYREMVLPSIPNGLCGCIYTQLSDVEEEINGLYTCDRAVCKVAKPAMQAIAAQCRAQLAAAGAPAVAGGKTK